MSWDDIMRRVLPPIGGAQPHITGPAGMFGAGEPEGRKPPSKIPHPGADFDYIGGQTSRLNLSHPVLRSPIDGVVENAGEGTMGRIAIRDRDGYLHEILHTDARHVTKGDPVVAGQIIGTMGNTGVRDQHVHYQLRDRVGKVVNPVEFWDQRGPVDPNPVSLPFLDQSQRAAELISGDNAGVVFRISSPDTPAQSFFSPFGKGSGSSSLHPVAERFGRWGSVPLPNMPVASDDPANFADRFGNWQLRGPGAFGHAGAPAQQITPDPGRRSETDDAPVRILSRLNLAPPAPASNDTPPLAPAAARPLLGIFSGKPRPDYPVWPPIFATNDRPSPDDDELYQRWWRFLDA